MIDPAAPEYRPVNVGNDRVVVSGDQVKIRSTADMLDWTVRRYRGIRVHFEEREYRVAKKTKEGRHFLYSLEPWPDPTEPASKDVFYDEAFVADRDRERRQESMLLAFRPFIPLVYVVAGFFPVATKENFQERWGIEPRRATTYSLMVEGAAFIAFLVLLCVTVYVGGFSGISILNGQVLTIGLLVLGPDLIFRSDRVMRETCEPPGFYEWVIRRAEDRAAEMREHD